MLPTDHHLLCPGRPPIHAIRGGESPVTRYVIGLEA